MGGGQYSTEKKEFDKNLDLTRIKPYGDTMNDGKIQISFTLPIEDGDKAIHVAKELSKKMGIENATVAFHQSLDENFSFFVVYGELIHTVDTTKIKTESVKVESMTMDEINQYIRENIKRKMIVIGATTGTDAHTVGIDAIMNMKGFAGHYGLERYEMIEAHNLGSQVSNEEFIKRAIELKADVLLVSQTVTQKDIHVRNLTNLVDLLEAEGIREKVILICGGPRITNELAKELGYDAGFGSNTYAETVASFFIYEYFTRRSK
ncbi:MAG: cobalamin B12-binding domain-containing protein [Promethearchaeota archaeon]